MLAEIGVVDIVEPAALQGAPAEWKAGRMNDVEAHPEAGAKAQHRAGILRDIGLVEGELDGDFGVLLAGGTGRGWV